MGWGELYPNEVVFMRKGIITEENKIKIEKWYSNGVTIKDIAKRLNGEYKLDTIKSYIRRNLKHLREKHIAECRYNYETLTRTKRECVNAISDRSFVKYNKSIYKINRSGNLVVNRKVAPVITFDTPRGLR